MNLFQRMVVGLTQRAFKIAGIPPRDPALATWFGSSTAAGVDITHENALTNTAVWAAVRLISESCASLPVAKYDRIPGGAEPNYDDPRTHLVSQAPNAEMTAMTFTETLMAHCLTWGNGYAEIERANSGAVIGLWPLPPNRVNPVRRASKLVYEVRQKTGSPAYIEPQYMLHVPGLGYDGRVGYSVITMAREALGLAKATEQFGASWFGNGSHPTGFFTHPGKMKEKARENFVESFERKHQGLDRANRIALLEEGVKWQQYGLPPGDAQFIATREFQILEVARIFNVPPHLLRELVKAAYASVEQQSLEFVMFTIRPWLVRVEQEYNRKLLLGSEQQASYFRFNADALQRGDRATRFKAYAMGIAAGFMSPDEARREEGWNPIADGSGAVYRVPQNYIPSKTFEEGGDGAKGNAGGV